MLCYMVICKAPLTGGYSEAQNIRVIKALDYSVISLVNEGPYSVSDQPNGIKIWFLLYKL